MLPETCAQESCPAGLLALSSAQAIATLADHTCAIVGNSSVAEASLYCWGKNLYSQLATPDTSSRNFPVYMNLGLGATPISVCVGDKHTCTIVLANDGLRRVYCWANTAPANREYFPSQVTLEPGVIPTAIACGVGEGGVVSSQLTCLLATGGSAYVFCFAAEEFMHKVRGTAIPVFGV